MARLATGPEMSAPRHVVWQRRRDIAQATGAGGSLGHMTAAMATIAALAEHLSIQESSGSGSSSSSTVKAAAQAALAAAAAGGRGGFIPSAERRSLVRQQLISVQHVCFPESGSEAGEPGESSKESRASASSGSPDSPRMRTIPEGPSTFSEELALQLENMEPPSTGSKDHGQGTCKPCLFVRTTIGCANGPACSFCHFTHKRHEGRRPCKNKRERYRKIVARQEQERGGGLGQGSGGSGDEAGAEAEAAARGEGQQAAREGPASPPQALEEPRQKRDGILSL